MNVIVQIAFNDSFFYHRHISNGSGGLFTKQRTGENFFFAPSENLFSFMFLRLQINVSCLILELVFYSVISLMSRDLEAQFFRAQASNVCSKEIYVNHVVRLLRPRSESVVVHFNSISREHLKQIKTNRLSNETRKKIEETASLKKLFISTFVQVQLAYSSLSTFSLSTSFNICPLVSLERAYCAYDTSTCCAN